MNVLLDTIAVLKGIEAIAAGKTKRKLTMQQRLDLCEFAARTQAADLAYHVRARARKSAEVVSECAVMIPSQPQPARKHATKRVTARQASRDK